MKQKDAVKFYGESRWKKMNDSGWLNGITVEMADDGDTDIPERDLRRAYNASLRGAYKESKETDSKEKVI
jgi:hypothetical protein